MAGNTNSLFVTIEGIDKSGKTTVINNLKNEFPDALYTTEPDDTTWTGKSVRRAIKAESGTHPLSVFHFFMADHYNHIEDKVKPALEKEQMVICDRYIDSRYAYQQSSVDEYIEGDTLAWLKKVQEKPTSTITPDLTIILDISPEESLSRMELSERELEVFEKKEFLEKVRENYLSLAEKGDRYVVVDGEREPDVVSKEVIETIQSYV